MIKIVLNTVMTMAIDTVATTAASADISHDWVTVGKVGFGVETRLEESAGIGDDDEVNVSVQQVWCKH